MSLSDTDQQWKTHVKVKTDLFNMIFVVSIQVLQATLGASYSLQCVDKSWQVRLSYAFHIWKFLLIKLLKLCQVARRL